MKGILPRFVAQRKLSTGLLGHTIHSARPSNCRFSSGGPSLPGTFLEPYNHPDLFKLGPSLPTAAKGCRLPESSCWQ